MRIKWKLWRILSNPPFLLIKGSEIALSWTYFSSVPFPVSITADCRFFQICTFPQPCLMASMYCSEKVGGKIGRGKLDREYLLCGGPFPCECNWLEWWIERTHGRSCVWVRNVQGQLPSRLYISVSWPRWCLLNCPELLFSSSLSTHTLFAIINNYFT